MIGKWMDFLARTQVIRLRYQLITSTCAALSFITMYRRSPDLHLSSNEARGFHSLVAEANNH
jgi:hypothetical protein